MGHLAINYRIITDLALWTDLLELVYRLRVRH